ATMAFVDIFSDFVASLAPTVVYAEAPPADEDSDDKEEEGGESGGESEEADGVGEDGGDDGSSEEEEEEEEEEPEDPKPGLEEGVYKTVILQAESWLPPPSIEWLQNYMVLYSSHHCEPKFESEIPPPFWLHNRLG
ncbi:MAG: hypothetical protein Q9214_006271, partial [Letrouitia sp. 1 TL-2023]